MITSVVAIILTVSIAAIGGCVAGAHAGLGLFEKAKLAGIITGGLTAATLAIAVSSGFVFYYKSIKKLSNDELLALEKEIDNAKEAYANKF